MVDGSTAKKKNNKHPYGTTLLARDTEANRNVWQPDEIGVVPVDADSCHVDGSSKQCPPYTDATEKENDATTPIHILIASFRDQLCPRTLHNAFRRALHPERVYIRILLQRADTDLVDDADCWGRYCTDYNTDCKQYEHQVYTVSVDANKAKGPTDARSKLSQLIYHDFQQQQNALLHPVAIDDFCMQTDSHMDFSTDWDTKIIAMWHRAENDRAVLSTYVADIVQNNQDPKVVPNLCMVTFTSSIRNWGTKECTALTRPKLTNMWGAGLSFHRCHAELAVPVDPYLDDVFDGEEGSRAIRFFTHGYDTYTPDKVLVTHDYHTHQSNPVVHTWGKRHEHDGSLPVLNFTDPDKLEWMQEIVQERSKVKTKGTKRVNLIIGIGAKDSYSPEEQAEIDQVRRSRYGVGNKRSLAQAAEFTGIDLQHKKMVKNKCGNLKWVPFTASTDSDYGIGEVLARSLVDGPSILVSIAAPQRALRSPTAAITPSTNGSAFISSRLGAVAVVLAIVVIFSRGSLMRSSKKSRHLA